MYSCYAVLWTQHVNFNNICMKNYTMFNYGHSILYIYYLFTISTATECSKH